jgi:hypothetical protein
LDSSPQRSRASAAFQTDREIPHHAIRWPAAYSLSPEWENWPGPSSYPVPGATVLGTGVFVVREVFLGRRSESPEQSDRAGPGRSRMSFHHSSGGLSVAIIPAVDGVLLGRIPEDRVIQ